MTGKILAERYEVQRQLGKQTGRQTLLARDLQTQKLVVIKQLLLGSDFEWQDLKLFEREAETLKTLSHPAIPRYLDYLEIDEPDSKGFALVQTYVGGKTLEEHLRSGRSFSENEVKELAKSLLEILIYLHDRNPPVIHRDIKPSNILLDNRSGHTVGQVYLLENPRPIDKSIMPVQPQGSEIKLTKTSEFIEIIIPPQGVGFSLIAWFAAVFAASTLLGMGVPQYLWHTNNLLINSVIMLSGSWLAAAGVMFLLCALFRELSLVIDRQQISYSSHLLGLRWNYARPALRQEICQLEIRQQNSNIYQVNIQAGNQKYQLGANQGLSESEIKWLATELSHWLGVKIKRTLTEGKKNIWF